MIQVYCKNTKTYKSFREGTTLLDMLPQMAWYGVRTRGVFWEIRMFLTVILLYLH